MKPYRWMVFALVVTATAVSAPERCAARDPPAPQSLTPDDTETAKYVAAGSKAFKAGKFAEAEAAFAQAFALKKVHDVAANLAAAEFAQGKMRAAAEHLSFALRWFPMSASSSTRDQLQ